jgi:hypothetical protein
MFVACRVVARRSSIRFRVDLVENPLAPASGVEVLSRDAEEGVPER